MADRIETLTRMKNRKLESSAALRSRLNEAEARLSEARKKLESLRREKAVIPDSPHLTHKLDYLINEIKTTESEIKDFPYRIDVLKLRLKAANERETVKKKILKTYRKSKPVSEIKKKSSLLLRRLKLAEETNQEILAFHKQRQQTEEATDRRINPGDVCGGFESLHILLELCKSENLGSGRKFTTWEHFPFQKI